MSDRNKSASLPAVPQSQRCPTHEQLEGLLRDGNPVENAEDLIDHVGECGACQVLLQRISSGEASAQWPLESALRSPRIEWPGEAHDFREAAPQRPQLSGFEILDQVGSGGMGIVWRAKHLALNRLVALKMMRAARVGDEEFRNRFRIEAEALARVSHPNFVQIYDVQEIDNCPFLVLELIEGGNLADRMRNESIPFRDAAELIRTAARAIQSAHDLGIVHRDLKPTNILLQGAESVIDRGRAPSARMDESTRVAAAETIAPRGDDPVSKPRSAIVKISDFGLARRIDAEGITQTGDIMGTPGYMSPEQARGDPNWSQPATDIYALGAVLYESLTGRPPFRAESPWATLRQVIEDEPLLPSRLNSRIPRDLETVCVKCLRKTPGERYLTAAELADDLQRFLDGEPVLARRQSWLLRAGKWARRKPALTAMIAATTLAVAALMAVWIRFTIDQSRLNLELAARNQVAFQKSREAEAAAQEAIDRVFDTSHVLESHLSLLRDEPELDVPALLPLRKRLVEQTIEYYRKLVAVMDRSVLVPRRAQSWHGLSVLYREVGDYEQARRAAETAIALRRSLHDTDSQSRDSSLGVMLVDFAQVQLESGRRDEAAQSLNEAIEIFQQSSLDPALTTSNRYYRLAVAYHALASLQNSNGSDLETVLLNTRLAGDAIHVAIDESPQAAIDPVIPSMAGTIYRSMGSLLAKQNRLAEARESFEQAIEFDALAIDAAPGRSRYLGNQAASWCYLASAWLRDGNHDEALAAFESARRIRSELSKNLPHDVHHLAELALIEWSMANVHRDQGQAARAVELYRAAAKRQLQINRMVPSEESYAIGLSQSLGALLSLVDGAEPEWEPLFLEASPLLERWEMSNPRIRQRLAPLRQEIQRIQTRLAD